MSPKELSVVRSHKFGAQVAADSAGLHLTQAEITSAALVALRGSGIFIREGAVAEQVALMFSGCDSYALDDLQSPVTTATIPTPIQFLQAWLPGFVQILTQARKIDLIIGIAQVGSFEDEEVIQGYLEFAGEAEFYGDLTNIPLASWNENFERRTNLRFEMGIKVGMLETLRTARMRMDNAGQKRTAATNTLEIRRNAIGFFGYNGGANRTYGFLNDPTSPAYVTAPNTGTGSTTTWSTKTFLNITADLRAMFQRLRTASGDNWDPKDNASTLAVATNVVDYLTTVSDFSYSVLDWMSKNYPKVRVISAPELNNANGGANVAILSADKIADGSSDGGATWLQMVPAKFYNVGTEKGAKGYVEDFGMATAGALLKRPFMVQRLTGI